MAKCGCEFFLFTRRCKAKTHICVCDKGKKCRAEHECTCSEAKTNTSDCKAEKHDCVCERFYDDRKKCRKHWTSHVCICKKLQELGLNGSKTIKCLATKFKHKCCCKEIFERDEDDNDWWDLFSGCKSQIHECHCIFIKSNGKKYNCKGYIHPCTCRLIKNEFYGDCLDIIKDDPFDIENSNHECTCDLRKLGEFNRPCYSKEHMCTCDGEYKFDFKCNSKEHKCFCSAFKDTTCYIPEHRELPFSEKLKLVLYDGIKNLKK